VYGFERSPHGDFCFSVSDVATEETIHGRFALHVALDVRNCGVLVVGLLEFEGVFEFALKMAVGRESEAPCSLARGVKGQKLIGHICKGLAVSSFSSCPGRAA